MIDTTKEREVRLVEVGPRDGLQNEPALLPTPVKIAFIEALATAGFSTIETTSFVHPQAVPQLADADEVMRSVTRRSGVRYFALVPNVRGFDRALATGTDAIALFTSATDAFANSNVGASIDATFDRFAPVASQARSLNCWIRGYVSVAFGCPYSGVVRPEAVMAVADRLFALGCDEVSIADTIGAASPYDVAHLLDRAARSLPLERLALHFHDTAGRAIDNVAAGLMGGVHIFDSSAGGLGGCPFAPGAPGNVATEELLDFFSAKGWHTGIDRAVVAAAVSDLAQARLDVTSSSSWESRQIATAGR